MNALQRLGLKTLGLSSAWDKLTAERISLIAKNHAIRQEYEAFVADTQETLNRLRESGLRYDDLLRKCGILRPPKDH